MMIEHVAIWTNDLERLRTYYCEHFGGRSNALYTNESKQFSSYFISFDSGTRLELMTKPGIPAAADPPEMQLHLGIIHLAFSAANKEALEAKAVALQNAGYKILSGPRVTGDGYYEFETLAPDNNRIEVTCLANQ